MSSPPHTAPRQYQASYGDVPRTEYKVPQSELVYQGSFQGNNTNHAGDAFPPSQRNIGWMTPLIMVATFLIATVIGVGHYLYCYFLDRQFVDATIPQNWSNTISVAFAHAFSTALAASASTAFTQLLWWYLRRKSMPLSRVDALFTIGSSPLNLYQLDILRAVPLLWFFGLFIPLISVATIFPPGSLVVQQQADIRRQVMTVPTLDVDYRGNGSAADFFSYALFTHGSDGEYRWPDVRYYSIGKRTLLGGSYLTRPSPCGVNCTYDLVFPGPSLRCEDDTANKGLEEKVFQYYANSSQEEGPHSIWDARGADFMAAPYSSGDHFQFDLSYRDRDANGLKNMSCTTFDATYIAHVEYLNSIQTVTVSVTQGQPLNASLLGLSSLFYDVVHSVPTDTGFEYAQTPYRDFTMDELSAIYHGTQLRAIRDTLIRPLSGAISSFGTENYFTINTLVQDTALAEPVYNESSYTFSNVFFDLSPTIMEELMRNVTISTFNDAEHYTSTTVKTIVFKSAYVFEQPYRLIGAYAGSLGVCLIFVLLGFRAMLQNGVSATSGGFFQILCTTQHSDGMLNRLAKQQSLGGAKGISEELAALKVRFGIVTDAASGGRHAAFGTSEETELLLKGP